MLVSFQFPISDVRPFTSEPSLRLPFPDWPYPATGFYRQFVNYFGEATERRREADRAWPDEIKFVEASRGFRFLQLEKQKISLPNQSFFPSCAYRRLFCDGGAVVRVEIGITHNNYKHQKLKSLSIEEVLKIVQSLAEMRTVVRNRLGNTEPRSIITQGKALSNLYAYASMNRQVADASHGYKFVEPGDPMILVELEPEEVSETFFSKTEGFNQIPKCAINMANAVFYYQHTSAGIAPTWIIQKAQASLGQLRSLRICLLRLHAEREVLDLVIKQICRKRILSNAPTPETVDLLDEYFNERTKVINRKAWAGITQSEIISAFDASNSTMRPVLREQLIQRYEGSRLQVWRKIRDFQEQKQSIKTVKLINVEKGGIVIKKQITVSGTGNIVNAAEYMSHITSTVHSNVSNCSASDELIDLLTKLSAEIERISSDVPPELLKKMGKNVEALSKEVGSEEPDRRWYEVSLKGILEAATAVGQAAEPVITIAKKISSILHV